MPQITLNAAIFIPVILGLVQFAKEFGVVGKWSRLLALCLGVLLGIVYQVSQAAPGSLADWLLCVIYGLALGMTAGGIYDFSRQLANENAVKIESHPVDDDGAEVK